MSTASEVVEAMTYVRTCGLNEGARFRFETCLVDDGYSPSYIREAFDDAELVNSVAYQLGWDYVLDVFKEEGTK